MPAVLAVSRSATHTFSKPTVPEIFIDAGLGVRGDAHAGVTVRHRYHVRKNPTAPNLCQVHLIHAELFAELALLGIPIAPGDMGENITTTALALLQLPRHTRLHIGPSAVLQVTGLREPCKLMNDFRPGLMQACLARAADGSRIRKAGIMTIALTSGPIHPTDQIRVELPPLPHLPLAPV